ncbi:sodium/hydrogen exchanger 3 [Loa loa]|uniref:Sodium/hydrogen exchanger n=1 Tax=Loa loa TaxID=7209 RepID=A0A1S0UAI2_LOALO|nr:sodium/hydrogen exchanger 3 [Loa loa]EFO27480.2 sodium/hydrogen exchanger 3 [Loa loa]
MLLLLSLLYLHCVFGFGGRRDSAEHIEQAAEKRAYSIHRIDTLILLIFVALLVLIVLTAWFFKHHRLRFIHETGLTLCYGLLIGILLRYTNIGVIESQTIDVMQKNRSAVRDPPDYLRLEVESAKTQKVQFHYELMEGFFGDKEKQSERHLEQKAVFSPEIFFNLLLPPIIFNAGYSLKKRHFFRNIGSILTFAFVGTTISAVIFGIMMHSFCWIFSSSFTFKELLFFGALMSSTDPVSVLAVFQEMEVESDLYALVFGESVLNDAVAIVLSSSVDNFAASDKSFHLNSLFAAAIDFLSVFLARSLLLGSVIGCATALITKMTEIKEFPLLEAALFILLSYLSFLLAEFVELTGIVAVLFCAICQAHYTYNNLSDEARTRTKQFFEEVSFLMESFIFCYIGVSVFVSHSQQWSISFFLSTLLSVFLSRAAHIYPLSAMLNIHRKPKIPQRYQHMMLFSGLRGAMAFALAYRNTSTDNRQIMATTTSMVVIVTVLFNGGLTSWFTEYLGIRHGVDACDDSQLQLNLDEDMDTLSRVSGQNPWDKAFLPRKWYNFDASFMKPFLTNANPTLLETMPSFMAPFAKIFTTRQQLTMYTRTTNNNGSVSNQSTSNDNPFLRPLENNATADERK